MSFSDHQYTSVVSEIYPGNNDCFKSKHQIHIIQQTTIELNSGNEAIAEFNHTVQEAKENINSENECEEDQA